MVVALVVILILFLLCFLSTRGRTKHPGLEKLQNWAYAHRGLHGRGVPENSMEAFRLAKAGGYGIELDIHLLRDGNLAVIHDSLLIRTTGAAGKIEELTTEQLADYKLEGTDETIPQLQQVLDLYAGSAPLIIELKSDNNCDALCKKTCQLLDNYSGVFCLESFDPRCIYWLRKNRPDIIRGQLTENYFRESKAKIGWVLKFLLANQMLNFLTLPDFVAYRFCDRKTISNLFCCKFWGVQGVTWTLKSQEEFDIATAEGWLPIFEGFKP